MRFAAMEIMRPHYSLKSKGGAVGLLTKWNTLVEFHPNHSSLFLFLRFFYVTLNVRAMILSFFFSLTYEVNS